MSRPKKFYFPRIPKTDKVLQIDRHDLRKNIARVTTVIKSTQRQQLRKFYAGKKHIPLDLRPKQTRAKRRALTKHELNLTTEKQKKKERAFPQRKFAVKVSSINATTRRFEVDWTSRPDR